MYSKIIEGGYILAVGTGILGEEIAESEYNEILSLIHNRPTPPTGYTYKLKADTLTWELVELPPIEEDDEATESDYIEALNDVGVDMGIV